MKRLINKTKRDSIYLDEISDNNIIAIKVLTYQCADRPSKYVLINDGRGDFRFVNGTYYWDANDNRDDLLNRILKDDRCEVFVFDDIKELGKWLIE